MVITIIWSRLAGWGSVNFDKLRGRRALICGEVGVGKTRLLTSFLRFLVDRGLGKDAMIIDLAPEYGDIGRSMESYYPEVRGLRYMRPSRVYPPRLLGRDGHDVLHYAEMNLLEARKLLEDYARSPTRILLVNDLTIYLHAGDLEDILRLLDLCETFAATAYEGAALEDDKGSGVTAREKHGLSRIKEHMDFIVNL
jgi:GTPase SAR1 family protein